MREEPRIVDVDRVDCRLVAHRWSWAEKQASEIDRYWAERRRENPTLYDGSALLACRVELTEAAGARLLRLDAFETSFSRFLAWREFGWPDRSVYNCFAIPAVRSQDGAYLVGEMGAGHSAEGQLYFPGGTPDHLDIAEGGVVELIGSLRRELREETGLSDAEGVTAPGWTVIFDGQRVACVKRIDWPAPAAALRARVRAFLAAEAKPELCDVHMLPPGDHDEARLPPFMTAFLSAANGG